jgi:hypothetical protein
VVVVVVVCGGGANWEEKEHRTISPEVVFTHEQCEVGSAPRVRFIRGWCQENNRRVGTYGSVVVRDVIKMNRMC